MSQTINNDHRSKVKTANPWRVFAIVLSFLKVLFYGVFKAGSWSLWEVSLSGMLWTPFYHPVPLVLA